MGHYCSEVDYVCAVSLIPQPISNNFSFINEWHVARFNDLLVHVNTGMECLARQVSTRVIAVTNSRSLTFLLFVMQKHTASHLKL